MTDKDFIGPRALNDYTVNAVKSNVNKETWEQPRKVAMCIGVAAPGVSIDTVNKQTPTEPTE